MNSIETLPQLKVYEVDYSFIISNYLNVELWEKSWNLFIYKDYIFTLNISQIDTESMRIYFRIKCNKLKYDDITVGYSIRNMSINILKNSINYGIYRLISQMEVNIASTTSEYKYIRECSKKQEEMLKDIANKFLDENKVTHEEIRDVYIDHYISENNDTDSKQGKYLVESKYQYLGDLWLIFANSIKDSDKSEEITKSLTKDKRVEILKEVEEHMKYLETEEATEDFKDRLEDM